MTIPLLKKQLLTYLFLSLIYTFFHFGVLFCIIFTYYDNHSYIVWKNKNQLLEQYTVIYLQLTSIFTVRFGAVPIPLYAVQRYVPLLFLLVSRTNWFPVSCRPLSLPLAYTLVQVMFGVGSPSAIHSKVILGSPSTTTTSLLTLLNSGGSFKELKTNKQLCTLSVIYSNMTLGSPSTTTTSLLIESNSGVRSDSSDKLSHSQNLQNWNNLPQNLDAKIIVKNFTKSQ